MLRKKNSQVSTLHVIHHGCMPMSVWFGVKFTPGNFLLLLLLVFFRNGIKMGKKNQQSGPWLSAMNERMCWMQTAIAFSLQMNKKLHFFSLLNRVGFLPYIQSIRKLKNKNKNLGMKKRVIQTRIVYVTWQFFALMQMNKIEIIVLLNIKVRI